MKLITANMATIPSRLDIALKAIDSIYDQVQLVRVYLNNFKHYPKEMLDNRIKLLIGEDLRSAGKFYWSMEKDQYYFSIDDDFIYPKDYVDGHLELLKKYNNQVVVTLHGKILHKLPLKNYFQKGIKKKYKYHWFKNLNYNTLVHILGTGVSAFDTSIIRINRKNFKYLYMDDIEVSMQLQKQKVPIIVRKHEKDYLIGLKPKTIKGVKPLYEEYIDDDSTHTENINSIAWEMHKPDRWENEKESWYGSLFK